MVEASGFVYDYFIKPIISPETQGYNLVNTAVYMVLLVIACAIIYLALRKKITFNKKFFVSLIPYIFFGISMRVIMHQIEAGILVLDGIVKTANPLELGFWFFTPGIWILTFVLVIIGLLISGILHKKEINYKILAGFGVIVAIVPLLFNLSRFNNWGAVILTTIAILLVCYTLCAAINKFTKYKILNDKLNIFVVLGQGIDGIASSIAITYFSFSEQHVVSNALLNISPLLFISAKLILAMLICWALDDYLNGEIKKHKVLAKINEKKNIVGFMKVILAILGFATGLASLLKLGFA